MQLMKLTGSTFNNVVSFFYKDAVQFSDSFVTSLPVFVENLWNSIDFLFLFLVLMTLTEIVNTSRVRSAVLVLSVIN